MPWANVSHPLVSQFGDTLRQAGYSEAGLRQAVGTSYSLSHNPRGIDIARRRLRSGTALHTLIKLFCLGIAVPTDELTRAVGRRSVDHLARIPVVTHEREAGR